MRALTVSLLSILPALHIFGLEVVLKNDFDKDKGIFERSGDVVVTEEDTCDGTGKCLLYSTEKNRVGFGAGFDKQLSFRDLRASFCIRLTGVTGLSQNWPVAEPRDNSYNKAVGNVIDGKLHTGWPAGPKENNQTDGRWGTVTLRLFENRFNSNHVLINPNMHECRGVSFHGGNVSPESPASVAIDNFVLYRGDDTEPPEPVKDLSAGAKDGVVTLTWSRPEDDLFAVRYEVYRSADPEAPPAGDKMLSAVHTLEFSDDTVVNPGTYHYRVVACDFAGNRSAASDAASITLDDDGSPVSEGERE